MKKKTLEKLLNNVAANSNNLLSSKVNALDVQLVVLTTQQIKDFITDHFRGYHIKFKEPGEGAKSSSGVSTPTRRDFSRGFRDNRKPVKNFATTSHDMSFVMRLTLESILVHMMDIKERFLTLEVLPNGEIVEVDKSPIPGNFSRISEAEHRGISEKSLYLF
ncbi:hypothetical protein BDC45DRAFT_541718 [Circinella umbellata]|nr:hypothetical protein BDC45DRAFT_541718 [Circinella umbellata]